MEKEAVSNCYYCGQNLVEDQRVVVLHQYFYCDEICLDNDVERIKLKGDN